MVATTQKSKAAPPTVDLFLAMLNDPYQAKAGKAGRDIPLVILTSVG